MKTAYTTRPWQKFYPDNIRRDIATVEFANLADFVTRRSAEFAARPAFSLCLPNGMGGTLTYAQVNEAADAFALYLREVLGLKAGSRVALQSPNMLGYPVVAFGVMKAGCILVNVNPLYTAEEVGNTLKDATPDCLVIIDMFADKLPKALQMQNVPHIVLVSVTDFMKGFQKLLVNFVQKRVRKAIPPCPVPATPLAEALAKGRARKGTGKVASYTADVGINDVACLQYTGGTTGVSKGAMLSHGNLLFNMEQSFEMMKNADDGTAEILLTALPLYHIFAFTVNLLAYYNRGAHNVLIPSPRPISNLKKAFEKYPFTFMTGVNTLYNALNNEDWFKANPPKTLRNVSAGGMALHVSVAQEFERLTGCNVVEGYGLTETAPVLTFNPLERIKLGTIGVPVPSTDIRIVDDNGVDVPVGMPGELIARGPQVMRGYWNRADETAKALKPDGWFYTGDIATMDEDGYFTIVDRKKDMINVSGFNVYPNEIEDLLATHPGIVEAAIIGVPDEHSGEVVKAFVVRRDKDLQPDAIRKFCREHITGYKVPKYVVFRDDLPKTPVGKILRKDLCD